MPTAIEQQIQKELEQSSLLVEEVKGEYRPSQSASWSFSARSIRYVLAISLLLIMTSYLLVERWELVQGLFQQPLEPMPLEDNAPQSVIPLELQNNAPIQSKEPISEQKKIQEPTKPALPAEVKAVSPSLPALDESDSLYRAQWAELWSNKQLLSWVETEQLVRKAAVLTVNLAEGRVVRNLLRVFKPESPFMVELLQRANSKDGSEDIYRLDPASYQRFTPLVDAVVAADTEKLLGFYLRFRPLFHSAYLELGYPEGSIENAFLKTLKNIQAAPILDHEVRLVRPKVMYQFQDQNLEQRSALDKQLFRLGPENMRKLQEKTKELEAGMLELLN